MQWMQGYPFYLLFGSMLGLYFTFLSFKYRDMPGRRHFWLLSLFVSLLILTTAFELLSGTFYEKLWWRNVQQIPLFFSSLFIYGVAADYVGKPMHRTMRQLRILSIPLVAYFVLIFTDQTHHLMRSYVGLDSAIGFSEILVHPTMLNMTFIAYSQLLTVFSIFILVSNVGNTPQYHRKQHILLIVSFLIPVALVFSLPALHVKIVGYTALSFIPGLLVGYYALFRYQLLSMWPIAKDKIFEIMTDGIMLTNHQGVIVDVNPAAERLLRIIGYSEPFVGRNAAECFHAFGYLSDVCRDGVETQVEIVIPDETRTYHVSTMRIGRADAQKYGLVLTFADISEKKRHERDLIQQATVDELTGVFTRKYFVHALKEQLHTANSTVALFMMDIDDFKTINDRFGHMTGDQVLVEFCEVLREEFEDFSLVGRMGGEEFAVFLKDRSSTETFALAEKFRAIIEDRVMMVEGGTQFSITLSIGIAFTDRQDITFEELYHDADQGLYASKGAGKNRAVLWGTKQNV